MSRLTIVMLLWTSSKNFSDTLNQQQFSKHVHMNVSKEKSQAFFLIKHVTSKKCGTPLFFFLFDYSFSIILAVIFAKIMNLMICEKKKRTHNVIILFYFFPIIFYDTVYSYEVRCMIWIKKLCTCHYE